MEGAVVDRQLRPHIGERFRFALAREEDEGAIRRLLRENPMAGDIQLAFEREPNYFKGMSMPAVEDRTVLAFEGGDLVCMGRCSIRNRYINGRPRRVGYLSELRLDRRRRGRADIVRRGYKFFQGLDKPAEYYFTSIASDNERSVRLLERGVPGLPAYTLLGEFVTLVLPLPASVSAIKRLFRKGSADLQRTGLRHLQAEAHHLEGCSKFLNQAGATRQLASHWTREQLAGLIKFGMAPADIQLVTENDTIIACAALWDQRCFRQTVIHGYSRKLALARPWLDLKAKLFGSARLPVPGSTLAHAFLSPLAASPGRTEVLMNLIQLCAADAAAKGIEYITLGFDGRDDGLKIICKKFRCRKYFSRLYQVQWPGANPGSEQMDGRTLLPELAFL